MVTLEGMAPETDPEMAKAFFRTWYGGSAGFVTITQMLPGLRKNARHVHANVEDVVGILEQDGLNSLVYADSKQWNLYMSVGLSDTKPARGRKGGKKDVSRVPGIWIDLDVDKHGSFEDEEDCLSLLRSLPSEVWPTTVVATGTGGVHAYWKTRMDLEPGEAEHLAVKWWTYLSSLTDAKIDKLCNADRLMKLPGSVRWPKITGDQPALVRLIYTSTREIDPETLEYHASEAFEAWKEDLASRSRAISVQRTDAMRVLTSSHRWNSMMMLADIETDFNLHHDWDEILLPLGWTKLDTDTDGRDIWARPGLTEWELHKSAATDYDGSHVMSLFSDALETGLTRLLDTGVALTKYRVYIECVWNGNEAGYLAQYLEFPPASD